MQADMQECMYACMDLCMHVHMHACMHVRMYACMHVRMYACTHVCMYACMHVLLGTGDRHVLEVGMEAGRAGGGVASSQTEHTFVGQRNKQGDHMVELSKDLFMQQQSNNSCSDSITLAQA